MANPTIASSWLEKPRKRLIRKYHKLGTWRRVARVLSDQAGMEINPYYPYEFATRGKVPANKRIQRVLGIPRRREWTVEDVNRHLDSDSIQDLPQLLLKYALDHREEIL